MNVINKNYHGSPIVILLLSVVILTAFPAISSAALASQFFKNYSTALQVEAGASYDMNDPAWLVNGKQNRNIFAYKVFAALFMLGYQTEMYQNGNTQVNVFKVFQSRNGISPSGLIDATSLLQLDQQLVVREQLLSDLAAGFPATVYGHIQSPAPNDVSKDTIAALQVLTQSELPATLQMSATELVQCIAGQCNGFIKDAGGVNDIWTPVDMASDYRFVLSYFDPLVTNSKLPTAAVVVETNLHEYAHYLDGFYYGLGGYYSGNFQTPLQPHFGVIDSRGFYDISYDITTGYYGCFTKRSSDPKDWISRYGYTNYGDSSCSAGKGWPFEEWAEAFQMYVTAGRVFRGAAMQSAMLAQKYDWLKANVFDGREYDTDLAQATNSGCNDVTGFGGYMHCNSSSEWDFTLPHSVVHGVCGVANGVASIAAPASALCATGSPTAVCSNSGSWGWNCRALNGGNDSAPCTAPILTGNTPGAPIAVSATGGNIQAIVTFSPPVSSGDRPINGYTVTSNPAGGIDAQAGTTALTHTITGLTNGISYSFTVRAHNDFGDGPASLSSNSVTPSWSLVADENFESTSAPGLPPGWQSLVQLQSEGAWYTNAGSNYPAAVSANSSTNLVYFNSHSAGMNRSARLVTPPFSLAAAAGAKVSFWMYRDGDGSAGVWNTQDTIDVYVGSPLSVPHMNGSEVKIGSTINRSRWLSPVVSAAGWYHYVFDIPNSFAGNNIYIMFLGYSAGNVGVSNDILLDDITVAIPAGAPTINSVIGGKGQATVSFAPPLNDGGSVITGYTVVSNPAGGIDAQSGSAALTHTVTGLTNGTPYTFTVMAKTVVGNGLSSSASTTVVPADVPGPPTIGTVIPGNGSAVVNFSLPANNGGATIDSYMVTSYPGGVSAHWTSSPITVPGLTNGTAYAFTVTAANSAGAGPPSSPSPGVTPLLSYDYPTIAGTPLTSVTRGVAYGFTPISTKATSFTISGNLPPGLNFNSSNGSLSGIPTAAGLYEMLVITAHNSLNSVALPPFAIHVTYPLPTINAYPDAKATVGSSYGFWVYTSDATTIALNGTVPTGMTVTATNVANIWSLDWMPASAGIFSNIIVTAFNSDGQASLPPFTVTVTYPMPTISGSPAIVGMVGIPYRTFTPTVSCQSCVIPVDIPIRYTISGSLPPGLNFDTGSGAISGTPTTAGTYANLVVTALNDDGSASLPAFTVTISPRIDSFSSAAPLVTARQFHTSTSLPNGKVLVTGGVDSTYVTLSSAELYDPQTKSWGAAGALVHARSYHTATLLQNGLVLVAGGSDGNGPLGSAELYDPIANIWIDANASEMILPRDSHTATLLPDGRVLVLGGFDTDYAVTTSVELYNPATNDWKAASPMPEALTGMTVSLMANGKVLVAGGSFVNSSAEIYDPLQDVWSASAAMNVPRFGHSATPLANGKVLVVGGYDLINNQISSGAELYEPDSNSWKTVGAMAGVRQSHTSTLLDDGTVLVVGGNSNYSELLEFAELYNPVSESWSVAGVMAIPRVNFSSALLQDGNLLVTGGAAGATAMAAAELYHYSYSIYALAGPGGTITPSQTVIRNTYSNSMIVEPDSGYHIDSVLVDGVSQAVNSLGAPFNYTFMSVSSDHTIIAAFAPDSYSLDVTLNGSGGGLVSDHVQAGYYCNANPCSTVSYTMGSALKLYATSDSDSVFSGWSSNCGGSGDCPLVMDAPMVVTAQFDRLQWVHNENRVPQFYGLLRNAYTHAGSGDTIKTQTHTFAENLLFDNPIAVKFEGGYDDAGYQATTGFTTIQGTVTISSGKVTVRRFIIR